MNSNTAKSLYSLLPAIYQTADEQRRESLQALLAVMERELELLEQDIGDLYENWFIETCDDWVIPYIGDLVSASDVVARNFSGSQRSPANYGRRESRAYVANTLAYRRRKGTTPILEQLARDVTGWRARGVEFSQHLALTQHVTFLRPERTTVSLRSPQNLANIGSPFEQQVAYTAEVRRIASTQGRYNLPNVGLFLWRLQSYPLVKVTAASVTEDAGYYRVSPLGEDLPLFNTPQTETTITQLAQEIHVPGKLPVLPDDPVYQAGQPWQIFINGQPQPIPAESVLIHSLGDPEKSQWKLSSAKDIIGKLVAIDPELGRLCFLGEETPTRVQVSYAYGFSGNLGGGPYGRTLPHPQTPPDPRFFSPLFWAVEQERYANPNPLAEAVERWNQSVTAWEACEDLTAIPLARIEIPKEGDDFSNLVSRVKLDKPQPFFKPGIVEELTVTAEVGTQELIIMPGTAVDGEGRLIEWEQIYSMPIGQELKRIRAELNQASREGHQREFEFASQQILLLVIAHPLYQKQNPQPLQLIRQLDRDRYPEDTYLRLARLVVDGEGNILSAAHNVRQTFTPGILQGFSVILPPERLEAIVTPGTVIDPKGQQIVLDRNVSVDLRDYQKENKKQTIRLALPYTAKPSRPSWKPLVISPDERDNYEEKTYIPLAELYVPVVEMLEPDLSLRRERPDLEDNNQEKPESQKGIEPFAPGVVWGLTLTTESRARSAILMPGQAVDGEGQPILLKSPYPIRRLWRYRNQTLVLAIAHRGTLRAPKAQVFLFREEEATNYPQDTYLKLAKFSVDEKGKIKPIKFKVNLFKPGIVKGLTLNGHDWKKESAYPAKVTVNSGRAVNIQGEPLILEQSYQLDLSRYPGRNLLLFISDQKQLGWGNLDVVKHGTDLGWQQLGIVPEDPIATRKRIDQMKQRQGEKTSENHKTRENPADKIGIILIKDNSSYFGDLNLLIPGNRQLFLIAASGYRPHLQGNLSVQGTAQIQTLEGATSTKPEPGDLTLNGLLIQGKLTVRPGNLKHLHFIHSTLVPDYGGITVQPDPEVEENETSQEDDASEDWEAIAAITYWLCLIQEIFRLSLDQKSLPPQQRLQQLRQLVTDQVHFLWEALKKSRRQWAQAIAAREDESCCSYWSPPESFGANPELEIRIERSICGAISLASTVPQLSVAESILQKQQERAIGGTAIVAPGTTVEIKASTVLGTTVARRLEASDSLFEDLVTVLDRQVGCLRFCYVPDGSLTPLRYQCQPDLALNSALPELPPPISALAIASGTAFAAPLGKGIYRFENEEKEWRESCEEYKNLLYVTALGTYIADPPNPNVLLAGTLNGEVWRSLDSELSWKELGTNFPNMAVTSLLIYDKPATDREINPDDPNTLLVAGTEGSGVWTGSPDGSNWTARNTGLANLYITALASDCRNNLFAGTDGEGLWRFLPTENRWQKSSRGLTNPYITALATNALGEIFVGTAGGGVFYSDDGGKRWSSVERDWENMTPLLPQTKPGTGKITSQGTTVNGIGTNFRQELQVGDRIVVTNQTRLVTDIRPDYFTVDRAFSPDLPPEGVNFTISTLVERDSDNPSFIPNLQITALLAHTKTGTGEIASQGTTVIGSGTDFQQELQVGDRLVAVNQTRLVTAIDSDYLTINEPFCPDLPPEGVEFTISRLIVGTAGGGIDNRWRSLNQSLGIRYITALARHYQTDTQTDTIFAGTTAGSLWRSLDGGDSWQAINQGLKQDVNKKLTILARLQPVFTSRDYGNPAYAQLGQTCPPEIHRGTEDGSEMGAFSFLQQPQRRDNLETSLKEYLRFGLQAGIFYVT